MAELGVGYISIVPETNRITPEISRALNAAEGAASKHGASMGSKLASGVGKTLKIGAGAAGVAAGGAVAAGLTKGFGRLKAIEGAEAKLTGLGNSATQVAAIMDNANAAVKGTAYGLDAAATTAAMAVASGIKPGKELEQVLTTVADTAGIAGDSMDAMGAIFGSVAARGKLQGDDLMQLTSRGIPVLQLLGDELGKTAAEVSDMVSKGEIDFATFERAMRAGVGGAAKEAGKTFAGAFANMGAAAGRIGATVLKPFFGLAVGGFGDVTTALDAFHERIKPVAAGVGNLLQTQVVPALESAKSAVTEFLASSQFQAFGASVQATVGVVVDTVQSLVPVAMNAGKALANVAPSLAGAAWTTFAGAVSAAGTAVQAVAGPLGAVAGLLSKHPALVTTAVGAWAAFKTVPSVAQKFAGVLEGLNLRVGGMREQFNTVTPYANKLREAIASNGEEISRFDARMIAMGDTGTGVAQKMAQAYVRVSTPMKEFSAGQKELAGVAKAAALEASSGWDAADRIIAQAGRGVSATVTNMAGTVSGVGVAAFTGMKSAVGGVVTALGGPWGIAMMAATAGFTAISSANAKAKTASEQYASAVSSASDVNREFTAAVLGSTGALSEQAQEMAAKVVDTSMASLRAFQTQVDGFVYRVPEPDSTAFTEAIAEMALGVDWQNKSMANGSLSFMKYKDAVQEVNEANEQMGEYLEKSGHSVEDLSKIVADGGPEYEALVQHMRGLGDGGQFIADQLVKSREELDLMVEAAQRVDPAMVQASQAIDVLSDSAASGQDKLSALHSLLQSMGLAPKDAEQAMMDAAASVDEIVEAAEKAARPVEQLGDALFGANGKLEPTNESARALNERLNSMVGDLKNVAVNGGDVQEAMDGMAPAIAATANEFNLSEQKVRELIAAYGGVPEILETGVALDGAGEAAQQIGEVWAALENMKNEGRTTIEIGAVGEQAKAVMTELDVKWTETVGPDGKKNLRIEAADDDAIAKIQRVTQMAAELGDKIAEPKILLNTTQLDADSGRAKQILDALALENPSPQAQLIIDQLQNNQQIALGDLAYLAGQSSVPTADLDKALLDAGIQVSRNDLGALEQVKTKPKIEVDNKPAKRGIDEARSWLDGLKDKIINIRTRRTNTAADGLINTTSSHRFMADGATGRLSTQQAQIAPGGRWITWAEDETHGESFIPHAMSKRKRSTQILAETASIFGLGLVDAAGNEVRRDGSSVAPTSRSYRADGAVTPGQLLDFFKGKQVNGQQASRSLQGAPYDFGGSNWGDCSSTQGQGALFAAGKPATNGRFMSTANAISQLKSIGFKPGLGTGPRYAIGLFNGGPWGGHTSGTIYFGDGDSVNVEMGGGAGGQGKIGGAAAGASHAQYTDHAYLPLSALGGKESDDDIASTSVDGVSLKSGRSVSWGAAQSLFDQAKKYQKYGDVWQHWDVGKMGTQIASMFSGALSKVPEFDVGGRWPTGSLGRNESTKDEIVLTNSQWRDMSRIATALPPAGAQIVTAAREFSAGIATAQKQLVVQGRGFGGGFLATAEIVRDAEEALHDTRANIATQADNIADAERDVAEARKALRDAEKDGGGLTTAQRRKLVDAEEALGKARRDGKPDKIAAAEKRLARAREDADEALAKSKDKNAAQVRKAQDRLNKAEDKLRESRLNHREAIEDLQAAERTATAARFQAASELSVRLGEQFQHTFQAISGLFDEFARLAGIVDETRQAVSKLQMQQRLDQLGLIKAQSDYRLAVADTDRQRYRGAISIAQAEADLEQARKDANKVGLSSVEAMKGAMNRFYETGKFSIEDLTSQQIEDSKEVRAALWGVTIAQKQNAVDQLEAQRKQEIAALAVAQATLDQVKTAGLLRIQTDLLMKQTAELNGMTKNQARGAAKGMGGVGKVGSGVGKIFGAIFAGLAGFAVGGPLGAAAAAAPLLIGGIKDTAQGSIDIRDNRPELDEAWKQMKTGEKATLVGGALLGAAASGVGGAVGGAGGAMAGAGIGDALVDASIGSLQYSIGSKIESSQRRADDQIEQLNRAVLQRQNDLDAKKLQDEINYQERHDRAAADLEWAKMMQQSVTAPTEKLTEAFKQAAADEKARAERHHDATTQLTKQTNNLLNTDATTQQQILTTLKAVQEKLQQQPKSQLTGLAYVSAI